MTHINKQPVQIAISPLSWANEVIEEFGKEATAEICLNGAAAAGYDGVEMSRLFPKNASDLALLLQKYRLAHASGWHSGFLAERSVDEELAAVGAFASLLKDTGVKVMVYGECGHMPEHALDIGMSGRLRLTSAQFEAYGDKLTAFADALKARYGLGLAYHHHLMMVAETLDEVRSVMAATGASVGLLLDTGHAFSAGFDYTHLLEEFGDRINHIHLKDIRQDILQQVRQHDLSFNDGVRKGMFTVPGDGDVDFAPLAQFVKSSGYQGWMVVEAEQDPSLEPPEVTVTRARRFIQKTFNL
ncbi:myo-inosose-2 dehydratase [Pantoea sp. AS-PWVM4]|uniref:myo-inosose-2 dehydratase n=1 Tax=Pantoea sp. AS-PWVM4 TaxID=1332069 RepID=UPI00055AF64B|nr:myo-inosose-2 dehydratase [Pantoea sp. AS-PWVM4]